MELDLQDTLSKATDAAASAYGPEGIIILVLMLFIVVAAAWIIKSLWGRVRDLLDIIQNLQEVAKGIIDHVDSAASGVTAQVTHERERDMGELKDRLDRIQNTLDTMRR